MQLYQQQSLLQDYLHALQQPIQRIRLLTKQEYHSLAQTFDIEFQYPMSTIIEEETQRETEENQTILAVLRRDFNSQIKHLFKIKEDVEEILNIYKRQLQKLAMDVVKSEETRKTLQQKLNDLVKNERKKSKETERQQLKRSRKINKQNDLEKQKYKIVHKESRNYHQDDLQIRKAPSPLKQNSCLNCIKLEQDKNRWKILANKIEDFKKKSNLCEQQLKMKQEQIASLKQNIMELSKKLKDQKQQQQKKKLKKDNTTLRGQKVLMVNQIALLKKQLNEKLQLSQIQDLQIKKLRIEIENINSSLTWHTINLNQMRNSQHQTISKENRDQTDKIQILNQHNRSMFQIITDQQKRMQDINSKTKKIEEGLQRQVGVYMRRINELQSMLEDKNQTIIRLKTNGVGLKSDKNANYQSEMIKLLNRKLTEKQQKIRSLQLKLDEKGNEAINQQCQ